MTTAEARQAFLDFFATRDHLIVPSAPLVNRTDPTLFFVNAGMNPFKDIFMGLRQPPAPRIADTQKCLRVSGKHNDLEEVGHDTYHHTFFEMLGNWSFGDYFKREAIQWAWELLTQGYKLPPERLYITIFGGDEAWGLPKDTETYELWRSYVPAERIRFFGRKENFWEMGDTGPCGPCTEIHIDLRPNPTDLATPLLNTGNPLVIELWNLVFIQYNRRADGSLEPLPFPSVDTGMGLERLAMVLQGKTSTYDIDIFQSLRATLQGITGIPYGASSQGDVAIRVVCDHIRAIAFAIADGQLPSNTGAGYVIRRLLRRALRYGHQYLHQRKPFLHRLVEPLGQLYQDIFPEVLQNASSIARIIEGEEESFLHTLERGLSRLETFLQNHPNLNVIPGEIAFELYDTYGFPIDLTSLIAREKGLSVDLPGFEQALQAQKARSRQATQKQFGDWLELSEGTHSQFVGYDLYEVRTSIVRMREVKEGGKTRYHVVLRETPFYPEGGGQVSDTGYLRKGHQKIAVTHVYKELDTIIHVVEALPRDPEGEWQAVIDIPRREAVSIHHTATHLLHAALRETLGPHARQNGSLVAPEKLRFDFTHPTKLSDEELSQIETIVNSRISAALRRKEYRDIPYEEAIKMGAIALFGEKYGDKVRVVEFGGKFSRELCGGTHVENTLQLRYFRILSESAVASGVRRIEAVAGPAFLQWVDAQLAELQALRHRLKNTPNPIATLDKLLAEKETYEKALSDWVLTYARTLVETWSLPQPNIPLLKPIQLPPSTSLKDFLAALRKVAPAHTFIIYQTDEEHSLVGVAAPQNAQITLKTLIEPLGGKGGGHTEIAVGKVASRPDLHEQLSQALSNVIST